VPVPSTFIERLDLVFDLRARQKKGKDLDKLLWGTSRVTAHRLIKRVMAGRASLASRQLARVSATVLGW